MSNSETWHVAGTVMEVTESDGPPWTVTIRTEDGTWLSTTGQGTFYRQAKVGDAVDSVGYRDPYGHLVRVKYNAAGK